VSDVLEQESAPPPKPKRARSPDLRQRNEGTRIPDTLTRADAEQLAERLNAYWHGHGYPAARHWVETANIAGRGDVFVVRSNLVDGVPPR